MSEELKTEPQDIVQAVQQDPFAVPPLVGMTWRKIDELPKDVVKEE